MAEKSKKKLPMPSLEEISTNWKNLLQTLPPPCKRKKMTAKSETSNSEAEVWFDDVDPILIESTPKASTSKESSLVRPNSFTGLTKVVALDCEMVGVGHGSKDSILARVSIVNHFGHCVYDKYVKPTEPVTDYRTKVSGIRPQDLENAVDFKTVQKEVSDIFSNRILVGHALHNDLKVLYLDHPRKNIRDTSKYKPFRKIFNGGIPSLKRLTEALLGIQVQQGEHDSVQDAQAAMRLYTLHRKEWEKSLRNRFYVKNRKKK